MADTLSQGVQNFSTSQYLANNYDKVETDLFREVFFFISAFLTLIGNALVLLTLWKSSNLNKNQHRLIGNLAMGDLGSGIVVLIFNTPTAQLHRWIFGDFLCTFSGFFLQMLSFQTIITLACISVDRYYAICHALHYHSKMTRNKCRLMVLVSWLYPLLSCSPPFYGWGHYKFSPSVISCMMVWGPDAEDIIFSSCQGIAYYFATAVIIFCYVQIWRESRKTFITEPLTTPQPGQPQNNTLANQIRKELKVAKMIVIMILVFVVTWMPFVIFRSVQKWMPPDVVDTSANRITEKVTLVLFTCSTFVNPIIYSLLDVRFRRELMTICSHQ